MVKMIIELVTKSAMNEVASKLPRTDFNEYFERKESPIILERVQFHDTCYSIEL